MKLQINVSGSWRNVVEFDAKQREAVLSALVPLARAVGGEARWSVVDSQGKRERLGTLSEVTAQAQADMYALENASKGV